jgi:hypothetical protein
MELDAPSASPSMAKVGAIGPSSTAADGVLDDIAIVGAAVAVGAVAAAGGGPPAPLPADACLEARPTGHGIWRRRHGLGSRGGGSPNEQRKG